MSPFSLTVSAHGPFRTMAAEVAGKYVEMAGGAPADVAAVTDHVDARIRELAAGTGEEATIDLRVEPNGHGIVITVVRGTEQSVVRHPLMAKKG